MKIKFLAIAAMTLDGKIAKNARHMSDWTSMEDKKIMRALLDKCDAVIVGNNTYKTAHKPLSKRNCIIFSRSKNRKVEKSENVSYINPTKTNVKKIINRKKYRRIAILGGAQTYTYCLKHKMLDELYLTIEPMVFGKGIDLFASSASLDFKFRLVSIKKLNKQGSLLLKYKKSLR